MAGEEWPWLPAGRSESEGWRGEEGLRGERKLWEKNVRVLRLVGGKTGEWGEGEGLQLPKGAGGCSPSWRERDDPFFLGFSFRVFFFVGVYFFGPLSCGHHLSIYRDFSWAKIQNHPSVCAHFSI